MTPQEKWDSLPETEKQAVVAFIEQAYNKAVSQKNNSELATEAGAASKKKPYAGPPRMYPTHPDDRQYA